MQQNNKLIEGDFLLLKFPGKGGWTYVSLPVIVTDKKNYFNWVKVNGSIDDYELKDFHLMPLGDGTLFLSVKAEIRKKIRKQEGDMVHIVLYLQQPMEDSTDNLLLCLEDEPEAKLIFESFTKKEQQEYLSWIDSAKTKEGEVERIIKSIDRIKLKLRFTDKSVR